MNNILKFLSDLRANNNREWFNDHKEQYLEVKTQAEDIAARFIKTIGTLDPSALRLSPKDCMYRIYRDTRFSNDKTPYKTHIGIFVNPPYGKKSLTSGYYLHLEPGNSFICGGNYGLPTPLLRAIRTDIYNNIEEYLSIIESPEFKSLFPTVGTEFLKTNPPGFDRNWPYIQYLRPKDFSVSAPLPDTLFDSGDPIPQLLPYLMQIKRLNDFVNFTLEENPELNNRLPRR